MMRRANTRQTRPNDKDINAKWGWVLCHDLRALAVGCNQAYSLLTNNTIIGQDKFRFMSKTAAPTNIAWKDSGTPESPLYGDVYYSVHGGLAESRVNFLHACGLPDRWADTPYFCIAELGFGTGLNFLTSIWEWLHTPRLDRAQLDFISFEKHPLSRADAAKALAAFPEISDIAATLLDKWPIAMAGTQTIYFPTWRARLILHIGDVGTRLPQSDFKADAWFLDGFSPAKNPDMWADALYPLIADRTAQGGRLGSFTVAGHVRRGLETAGFTTTKKDGFGYKRDRLEAHFPTLSARQNAIAARPKSPPKIAIVGAGIAGASAAARLAPCADVHVFDHARTHPHRASGNPLALVIPRLDAGDTPDARACREAYIFACHALIGRAGVQAVAADHSPRDEKQARKFEALKAAPPLPSSHLQWGDDKLIYPHALLIHPPALIADLLTNTPAQICDIAPEIDLPSRSVNGQTFDAIILAMGPHLPRYLPVPNMGMKAGQVDWADAPEGDTIFAKNNGHYALGDGHIRLWGSSFIAHADADAPPITDTQTSQALNTHAQSLLDPTWLAAQTAPNTRASIRATTARHLPLIGAVPATHTGGSDNIYILGGLGSRGFGFASMGAEILASEILGHAAPVSRHIAKVFQPKF